jgi:hypothetical protein
MEVYGSGYEDDIDVSNYKRRDIQSHAEVTLLMLERVLKLYDLTLNSIELQKNDSIIGGLPAVNT